MADYLSNINKLHLFNFLAGMHFIGGVLIPFFTDWGGISFTQIMILQSVFMFSIFVLEIPTGAVADRFGRKASLILGAFVTIIAVALYSAYPNFLLFVVAEFLWAMGAAFMSGANEALVYDSLKVSGSEKTSKRILGRFSGFHLLGIMVSGPIGSIIAYSVGLRYAMLFSVIPFLIAVFVGLLLREPPVMTPLEKRGYKDTITDGLKYFSKHRTLKILAFDSIIIHALSFMLIWMYQPLLQNFGLSILFFGVVHAGIAGTEAVIMNRFEWLEKIFGSKRKYILGSALITGLSMMMLGINPHIELSVILIIIVGGFGLTRQALLSNYMNKHIESGKRATVLSTVSMLSRLASGLLYPLIGILVDFSLSWAFIILGIMIVAFSLISKVEEGHLLD
ncbi:MAG: MFS transporter [Candidatus Aenigmarchaeota archaeon]|nr:MFS transporter [Candidatus Aenigmarchaeota archaeon]